jgi:hypothetical protein
MAAVMLMLWRARFGNEPSSTVMLLLLSAGVTCKDGSETPQQHRLCVGAANQLGAMRIACRCCPEELKMLTTEPFY